MTDRKTAVGDSRHGRKYIYLFHFFNPVSFTFLAGNIITLLLLRLNASNTLIGITSSFIYVAYIFLPLGKTSIQKIGLIRTFGTFWTIRYIAIIPAAIAPFISPQYGWLTIVMILFGYFCFQIFRGIGIVSFSPVMNYLSDGPDRGGFMAKAQIVVHSSTIFAGMFVVFFLGKEAPLYRYSLFILLGIVFGITGAALFMRIREPAAETEKEHVNFMSSLKAVIGLKPLRRFFIVYGIFVFVSSFSRPFILVYAKQVYLFGDNFVFLLALFGSIGGIMIGLINKTVMDRLGFKPLMIFTALIFLAGIILPVFHPAASGIQVWIFLIIIFFVSTMGGAGFDTSSQAYFFQITGKRDKVNLGILYFLIMGTGGSLGSFCGGIFLDVLRIYFTENVIGVFRIFFITASAATFFSIILLLFLEQLGAETLRSALSYLFSPRDWRAMILLNRLNKSPSIDSERKVMRKIRATSSVLATDEVLQRLNSVSFSIRREALYTIDHLPWNEKTEKVLILVMEKYPFSSAHHAARLLGRMGSHSAVPALNKALESHDYLLQANAALALAEIGDTKSLNRIMELLDSSINPRVLIYCIAALTKLDDASCITSLIDKYHAEDIPVMVKDEIIFSLAHFWGADYNFFSNYSDYVHSTEEKAAISELQIRQIVTPPETGQYLIDNPLLIDSRLAFLISYISESGKNGFGGH